jgi:SNF2 family DNA or RNA helicase
MRGLTPATVQWLKPIFPPPTSRLALDIDSEGVRFVAKFFSQVGLVKQADTSEAPRKLLEKTPERKALKDNSGFLLGATDFNANVINETWPKEQLLLSEAARPVFQYLVLHGDMQDRCAEINAKYKTEKVVPLHSLEMNSEFPLSPYQQVGCYLSMLSPVGFAEFMEQGTGKTPVAIAAFCNHLAEFKKKNKRLFTSIIVAPKAVRQNWVSEFAKFSTRKVNCVVLRGTSLNRVHQVIEGLCDTSYDGLAIIMSYETLTKMQTQLAAREWDFVILDESHLIREPSTKRCKAAFALRDISNKRIILTGTPFGNSPLDLWAQLEFLEKGLSGFISWENFKKFYGVWDTDEAGFKKLLAVQNMPFLQEKLARVSFSITLKEAIPDLPEKVYDVIEVTMSDHQREMYDQLRDTLMIKIENELNSGLNKSLVVNSILTQLLRLAQITNGFTKYDAQYDEDGNCTREAFIERFDPNPKLETICELLLERWKNEKNCKTIIWTSDIPCIDFISERLSELQLPFVTFYGGTSDEDRIEAERRFNFDPLCPIFLGNQASGGTGLNLYGHPTDDTESETNCDWEIFYSQNWSPFIRWQAEARAHRRGTRCHVRITDLCVPGTIDEEIRVRVLKKKELALTTGDIRQILNNILHGVPDNE